MSHGGGAVSEGKYKEFKNKPGRDDPKVDVLHEIPDVTLKLDEIERKTHKMKETGKSRCKYLNGD